MIPIRFYLTKINIKISCQNNKIPNNNRILFNHIKIKVI